MKKNLTVVLPVHNAEATLRRDVSDVLDVAGEMAGPMRVIIVDDGSTDDTYDTAIELATRYPQIRVMRHAERQGLGRALDSLRSEVAGDMVLVHDGASRVDANQIRRLWSEEPQAGDAIGAGEVSVDDLRLAAATHEQLAAKHSRLAGFQRMTLGKSAGGSASLSRRDQTAQSGVGVIPPLPRPNFMGALANFALGE